MPPFTEDHHSLQQDQAGERRAGLLESAPSPDTCGLVPDFTSTPSKRLQKAISRRPKETVSSAEDDKVSLLLKTQRALEGELRILREELETLEQALRIESSGEDNELQNLVHKWKSASREAADEMFTSVRDRVNRMGGPAAWRDMQRKKAEWRSGGFDEPEEKKADSEDEEAADVEKRDLYAEYDVEPEESREESGGQYLDEGKDDDAFTMDMMLQSLNIELNVIGYDKQQQRWVD
ncbi:MAG: hypothetical protein M1836_005328 [Candelina mexicana]|nr:MAG: hypothetical protein M1836_005328 [Candelina mexicana]